MDELDQLIDTALERYSSAEAPVGLEDRVLRRIDSSRRRRRWVWAAAVPALAALILAIPVLPTRHRPVEKRIIPEDRHALEVRGRPAPVAPVSFKPRPAAAHHRRLPKGQIFPTPAPITPEERALLALAQLHPDTARALADSQKLNAELIEIPPIEIIPLQLDDGR